MPEPETAANNAQDRIAAIAMPPGTGALTARIIRISRDAIAPRDMTLPARMYSGIDNRISLFSASQASTTMLATRPSPQAT